MKTKLVFLSDDCDKLIQHFGNFETIENVFKIQYAYADGSFDNEDSGELDCSKVKWNGVIYDKAPLELRVTYNDEPHLSTNEEYTQAIVKKSKLRFNDFMHLNPF